MATAKKLDTFVLKDKFGLNQEAISEEAQASAVRRAEVMGWTNVSTRPANTPIITEDAFKCYSFEIWGVEVESAMTGDNAGTPTADKSSDQRVVAKETTL